MPVATSQLSGVFVADPAHSSFQFAIKHMKVSAYRAGFADVQARLVADDRALSLEGRARVESLTITNPPEFREHVVNGEDFFDAGNHPEVAFRSTNVVIADDGGVSADGELEIRGVARAVTATGVYQPPVEDPYGASRAAIELAVTIDRRDWGMDWQMPLPKGGDALGNAVEISVHLELVKQG